MLYLVEEKIKMPKRPGRNKVLGANANISTTKINKKKNIHQGKIKISGWAKKLGFHKARGRNFKKGIKTQHAPYLREADYDGHSDRFCEEDRDYVDFREIMAPFLEEYPVDMKGLATAVAFEAVRRHNITPETLDRNRITIENYVQYALFMRNLLGEGREKNLSVREINLSRLLDEEGRIDLLKVLRQESEVFGLEADLSGNNDANRRAIKPKLMRFLNSGEFSNPSGLYSLTERLRETLGIPNLSPELVYDSIPKETPERDEVFARPVASLETAKAVREVLVSATKRQMQAYGRDVGFYLLARKVKDLTEEDVSLPALDNLLLTPQHVISLMQIESSEERVSQVDWRHHHFDLSLNEVEPVIRFLRDRYQQDPNAFFQRYGTKVGDYNISLVLAEEGVTVEDLGRLHTLTGEGSVLAHLMGLKDERFSKWNNQRFTLKSDEVKAIASHLSDRYGKNPKIFFRVYGSNIAPVILAKELQLKGMKVSQEELSELLSDRTVVQELLGVRDEEFRYWNVKPVSTSLSQTEQVLGHLRERYHADPDRFFFRYSSNGYLAGELESEGIDINPRDLENLVSNGINLSLLMGVKDSRFSTWKHI